MMSATSSAKPLLSSSGPNMAPSSIQQRHQEAALEENQRAKIELQSLFNRIQNQRRQHAVTQFQCLWRRYCAKKKLEELLQESSIPRSKRGPLLDASPLRLESARQKFITATHLSNFRPVPQQQQQGDKHKTMTSAGSSSSSPATAAAAATKTFIIDTKSVICPREYLVPNNNSDATLNSTKGFNTPIKNQSFLPPPPLVMLTPDASCASSSSSPPSRSTSSRSGFPPRHTPPSSISSHEEEEEDHALVTPYETTSSSSYSKLGMFKIVEHAAIVLQTRARTMLAQRLRQQLMEEQRELRRQCQLAQQVLDRNQQQQHKSHSTRTTTTTMSVVVMLDPPPSTTNDVSTQNKDIKRSEDDDDDDADDDVDTSDSSMITERVGNLFKKVVDDDEGCHVSKTVDYNNDKTHDRQAWDSPIRDESVKVVPRTAKKNPVRVVLDSPTTNHNKTVKSFQPIQNDSDNLLLNSPPKSEDLVQVLYPVAEKTADNPVSPTPTNQVPIKLFDSVDDDVSNPNDWELDFDKKKVPVALVKPCHDTVYHDKKNDDDDDVDRLVPDIQRTTKRMDQLEPVYHKHQHHHMMKNSGTTSNKPTTTTTTTIMSKEMKKDISQSSWGLLLRRTVMGISMLCLLIAMAHHPTAQLLLGRRVKNATLFAEISKKRFKK